MPTEVEWGYLAGMVDGEGSIYLTPSYSHGQRSNELHPTWLYYEPRVSICGTCEAAIKGLADEFGGHLNTRTNKGYGRNGNKRLHTVYWQAQGKVTDVLQHIIPTLRIKKEQAELLLEFCESRLNRSTHKASTSEREIEIYSLIKEANHR